MSLLRKSEPSLLEKAKSLRVNTGRKTTLSKEELELLNAYHQGEVKLKQVKEAIGVKNMTNAYVWIATKTKAALCEDRAKFVITK